MLDDRLYARLDQAITTHELAKQLLRFPSDTPVMVELVLGGGEFWGHGDFPAGRVDPTFTEGNELGGEMDFTDEQLVQAQYATIIMRALPNGECGD